MSEYDPTSRYDDLEERDAERLMARLRRHEAIEAAAWAVFQTKGWPDMPGCILGRLMDLRAALGPPPDDDEDWPTVEPVKPRLRADEDVRSAIDSIHHD